MDYRWPKPLSYAALTVLLGVTACSSRPGGSASEWGRGTYTAPGPASDPWGPYIREAANRFSVPEAWIRAVMNQESGGHEYLNGELVRSGAGAMGLMQLMPATWSELAANNGLGNDPYDPHDNILAGSAYIRQMYDRFGSPGFLAAYNAGPARVDEYLQTGEALPDETVNYVASISPHLGDATPVDSGPVTPTSAPVQVARASAPRYAATAAYASADSSGSVANLSRTGDGCLRNADAAYDPASGCLVDHDTPHPDPVETGGNAYAANAVPIMAPPVARTQAPQAAAQPLPAELASYVEPARSPPAHTLVAPAYASPRARVIPAVATSYAAEDGAWAVQVGAFASGADARRALQQAQAVIGATTGQLGMVVMRVSPGAHSLYRARLTGFAASDATEACRRLHSHAMACFTVPVST